MKMIIMAGGSGTRLWPLSRTNYPKQFLKLSGMDKSIFQTTIERCLLMGRMEDLYLVTSRDYLHLVQGQIEEMGKSLPLERILLEPEPKNTLPAILCAVQAIRASGDDVCAVFASDHVIEQPQILADTIIKACPLAAKGFVTFGIKPAGPETGYGYIKPGEAVEGGYIVSQFKEKPDLETAKAYIKDGYLWNSGMFMFHSAQFDEAVKKYNPEVYEAFQAPTLEERFGKTPSISVDYGLIEKMDCVYCAPLDMEWNDIGNFVTFYDKYHTKQDTNGNVYFNDEIMLDSSNNLIYSEGDKAIAMIGLSDVVVVDQKDALLVCHRSETPRVRDVVSILKEREDPRADFHLTEYRPWGSFTILEDDADYKVKRLTVLPGKRLSYQMHYYRNEHWIIVSGTAAVVIDGEEQLVRSGESIYVQAGQKHRLYNPGKLLLEVIEVQNGEYFGEDDIVRFEDDYSRCD
ncbi:MAG: mannose-1-phosphate guanylyltransferase/mannose-6-phosphate isomerase [Oscillospiraceae bacterium]|nr:mannose-1-phosphate guanylyltransferase/mannose-6-phosphate isomerase [Oscillospiraceae bacterium]